MNRNIMRAGNPEQQALRYAGIVFVIVALASYALYFGREQIPFAGVFHSVAVMMLLGAVATAFVSFLLAYRYAPKQSIKITRFDSILLAVATTLVTGYVTFLLLVLVSESFKGLSFDPFTASWITGLAIAGVAYFVYSESAILGPREVLVILTITMLGGALTSMISSTNSQWWQQHFSALGMYSGTGSSFVFNMTLILSGFVIAILTKYLLQPLNDKEVNKWVGRPMVAMGIALSLVGLFPFEVNTLQGYLHNTSAGLIVVFFMVVVYGIRKTMPDIGREFMVFSYGCIVAVLLSYLLFARVGYFSLTAAELAVFLGIFIWITVFARSIVRLEAVTEKISAR